MWGPSFWRSTWSPLASTASTPQRGSWSDLAEQFADAGDIERCGTALAVQAQANGLTDNGKGKMNTQSPSDARINEMLRHGGALREIE